MKVLLSKYLLSLILLFSITANSVIAGELKDDSGKLIKDDFYRIQWILGIGETALAAILLKKIYNDKRIYERTRFKLYKAMAKRDTYGAKVGIGKVTDKQLQKLRGDLKYLVNEREFTIKVGKFKIARQYHDEYLRVKKQLSQYKRFRKLDAKAYKLLRKSNEYYKYARKGKIGVIGVVERVAVVALFLDLGARIYICNFTDEEPSLFPLGNILYETIIERAVEGAKSLQSINRFKKVSLGDPEGEDAEEDTSYDDIE